MIPNLVRLRAEQEKLMDLTGIRRRRTKSNDGHGGFTEIVSDLPAISCNLGGPTGESERVLASKLTNQAYWFITVPYDTDIRNGDQFVIGSRIYKMIYVPDPQSFLTALRCLAVDDGTGF